MIKNPSIVRDDGALLLTKDQEIAIRELRSIYEYDCYRVAAAIKNEWVYWVKKEPSVDSIYYPLGELEMHDVIAAAVSGHFATYAGAVTIINSCMDTADEQERSVLKRVLEILQSYGH